MQTSQYYRIGRHTKIARIRRLSPTYPSFLEKDSRISKSLAAPFPLIRPMRRSSQLAFILLLVAAVCCSGCRPVPPPKRVTTGIGLTLTYIPPESFTMGANPSEPGAKPAERPHKVTISKGF
jgi:hypothetical protein